MAARVISLYTGAGGLDLGFEAAGYEIAVAIDYDPAAVATLRHNRSWPVIDRDIHEVTTRELLATAGLEVGEADALIGGPPCQPFSKAAHWRGETRRLRDPRAATLEAYLRVLDEALPRTFVLETVPGFAYQGQGEGLSLIEDALARINRTRSVKYRCDHACLNAADYGVPQSRERLFIVGARDGTRFAFPPPTHAPAEYLTAWDAIGDLDEDAPGLRVRGKWAGLLATIPEGANYARHTARGDGAPLFTWRRPYASFLRKLAKNRPAWTITAQPGPAIGPFHWTNRRLSPRELCRLQTFPDEYEVLGTLATVQRQLGNAVPAALAEAIARTIRRDLLGMRTPSKPTLLPKPRRPIPAPEPARSIPRKYLRLGRR